MDTDVEVIGSGTKSDPYRLIGDIVDAYTNLLIGLKASNSTYITRFCQG